MIIAYNFIDNSATSVDPICLNTTMLDALNAKYVALIGDLKMIFRKEEKHYSVDDIIADICTADKGNLTFFSSEICLYSAETVDDVFFYIERECKYFDFTILKTFVNTSQCVEAKELMDGYIKEIENSLIIGSDLQSEYDDALTEKYKGNTKKLEIICDKNELKIKELTLIIETLQRCLKLPEASISVKDFKQNCSTLICRIPKLVNYCILHHEIDTRILSHLSAVKIKSLKIDDKIELKIPSDCDIEVLRNYNAKQKQPGCKKSARPIRSHNGYKRPKSLISSKAKKLNILLRILLRT